MSQQQVDLDRRARGINRLSLWGAFATTLVGVGLMLTIALIWIGLAVFVIGLIWFLIAYLIGKSGGATARDL